MGGEAGESPPYISFYFVTVVTFLASFPIFLDPRLRVRTKGTASPDRHENKYCRTAPTPINPRIPFRIFDAGFKKNKCNNCFDTFFSGYIINRWVGYLMRSIIGLFRNCFLLVEIKVLQRGTKQIISAKLSYGGTPTSWLQ